MRATRIYLLVVGIGVVAFGVLYLFIPEVLTDPTGFGTLKPEVMTDVRATYGGLQLAIGFFAIWTALNPQRYGTGLVLVALMWGCVAISRSIGLVIDGEANTAMLSALALEGPMTVVSLIMLKRHRRRESA